MIIDSHAHYALKQYDAKSPCLYGQDGEYAVQYVDRDELFEQMKENGIVGVIEPSIAFDGIEKQLSTVSKHYDYMWTTIGVHPTRCIRTEWKNRKKVTEYAKTNRIIAIGETGLDYHHKQCDEKQRRLQKRWFIYQLKLAHRLKLPLVLHIRMADDDGLKLLKRYRKKLHGGVAHCFAGDYRVAKEYVALGLAIGIGGKLLNDDEEGLALCDAVKNVPLSALLVETDAPYVCPQSATDLYEGMKECGDVVNKKRWLCNSSLILPSVIQKIADLRGESRETIENAVYQNTLRIFDLHIDEDGKHK